MIVQALLHFLAVVVIYHNLLLILGLMTRPDPRRHLIPIGLEVGMILFALGAMLSGELSAFVLAFGVYRLLAMLESACTALRQAKPLSSLLPVNLLVAASAFVAFFTACEWIFLVSYLLFWVISFVLGKKLMQRKMPS